MSSRSEGATTTSRWSSTMCDSASSGSARASPPTRWGVLQGARPRAREAADARDDGPLRCLPLVGQRARASGRVGVRQVPHPAARFRRRRCRAPRRGARGRGRRDGPVAQRNALLKSPWNLNAKLEDLQRANRRICRAWLLKEKLVDILRRSSPASRPESSNIGLAGRRGAGSGPS
jgi:hypothetical protein